MRPGLASAPLPARNTPRAVGWQGLQGTPRARLCRSSKPRLVAAAAGRGRHPAYLRTRDPAGAAGEPSGSTPDTASPVEPVDATADVRYRRADYSDVFQFESRQAFARCISGGEPGMRLAEAAMHVTAEDDAIASHSTVAFPVAAYLGRIDALVDDLLACNPQLTRGSAGADAEVGVGVGAQEDVEGQRERLVARANGVLRAAERYLFETKGFAMPEYGRSNVPANSVVDHAGVWEDSRLAYLHETLVRRQGHPATLALLLYEVCCRLIVRGVLPCAVALDMRDFWQLPRAVPLPELPASMVLRSTQRTAPPGPGTGAGTGAAAGSSSGGAAAASLGAGAAGADEAALSVGLNTCTSQVLVEMLRHLKRAYWPFSWDSGVDDRYPAAVGSHGGFRAAAKAAAGEEMSAVLAAVSKVAAWRLERGIWTSPGAGDIRRARAACERLVLLAGDSCPEERRDLAVLLVHCGELGAARLEMRTYLAAVAAHSSRPAAPAAAASNSAIAPDVAGASSSAPGAPAPSAPRPAPSLPPAWGGPDPFDLLLCRKVLAALDGLGGGVREPEEPLGVEAALRAVPPWLQEGHQERVLPLTW